MAVAVAIVLPVLKFVAVGALDFTDATADRSRLQGIADASALAGAAQLAIDTFSTTAESAEGYHYSR
jgi:Flp pilus assembly protein TadG